MVQVLQASQMELGDIHRQFNLQRSQDPAFFTEWDIPTPELTDYERHWLDQAKQDFLPLCEYPVHEELVKLMIVGPLLSIAGLFRSPFHPVAEHQVELAVEDSNNEVVRGRLDLLVMHQQLWVAVVESKRQRLDLSAGFAQALFYMLTSPNTEGPTFGFICNGNHGIFIKLVKGPEDEPSVYGFSDDFSLWRQQRNELYDTVGVLRHLGTIVTRGEVAIAA
ncbi:MAG: restriction endonuclease subunit R [Symploca sp. SIO2G7]|nr:restriction endonuclease subunit R [Symploca sp. SIO2G7]